jgi:hypothetical protein
MSEVLADARLSLEDFCVPLIATLPVVIPLIVEQSFRFET